MYGPEKWKRALTGLEKKAAANRRRKESFPRDAEGKARAASAPATAEHPAALPPSYTLPELLAAGYSSASCAAVLGRSVAEVRDERAKFEGKARRK